MLLVSLSIYPLTVYIKKQIKGNLGTYIRVSNDRYHGLLIKIAFLNRRVQKKNSRVGNGIDLR